MRCPTSSSSGPGATPIATPSAGSSRRPTSGSFRWDSIHVCPPTRRGTPWTPSANGVRPRPDRAGRPRSSARQALVLEHRIRARAGDVHAGGAPRHLRGCARVRGLLDEPQACPASAWRDRGRRQRRAHGPAGGRPAELYRFCGQRLEVTDPFAVLRPPPRVAQDDPLRSADQCPMRHFRTWLLVIGIVSLVAEAAAAAAVFWHGGHRSGGPRRSTHTGGHGGGDGHRHDHVRT